jgi:hypothetical protein
MKNALLLLALLTLATAAMAQTPTMTPDHRYLTADIYPAGKVQPDRFVIYLDATSAGVNANSRSVVIPALTLPDGGRLFWYDLSGLSLSATPRWFWVKAVNDSAGTDPGGTSPLTSVQVSLSVPPAPAGMICK